MQYAMGYTVMIIETDANFHFAAVQLVRVSKITICKFKII